MPEEEIMGVEQEVAQSTESEQQSERQEESQKIQAPQRRDAEYNWQEARRKMDHFERKIREQEELISKLQSPQSKEDDFSDLADDDIITVKQHKSIAAKIARQVAEEVVRQKEAATVDDRLRLKFSDYDQVVSVENLELLKQNDPELAMSLQKLADDPYTQSVAAYKLLKKSGYAAAKPQVSLEKKKALENSQKPVSVNAVSKQSAIGNVQMFENGLTKEMKAKIWAEMQTDMMNT